MSRRAVGPPAPTGTYRVQLTPLNGFAALAAAADHLERLGVSHAYVSPVLAAAPGSQHGYDVVDHTRVNDELGGEDGLRRAGSALREHGLGVVVDIVPNHMALTVPEHLNTVLWSVLRAGADSPYASWLDVDWSAQRPLLLPFLGRRIDECLDAGEIVVDRSGGPAGEPVVRYYEHTMPVRPGTEDLPLEELLAAQAYRLAFWRVADEELNYRRFFDVDTLLGLRVEDPSVFEATHATVVRLVREGLVSGLRVDHPDGLADPAGYLRRLAARTRGCWLVVEKILQAGEELPRDWECDGTTGYDALAALTGVFVDPAGEAVLTSAFEQIAGADETWPEATWTARRDVLRGPLVPEVDRLAAVAYEVCQAELRLRDHSLRGLTDGLVELLTTMPVYRAYVVPGQPADSQAAQWMEQASTLACEHLPERASEITVLRDLALGRLGRSPSKDEFCVRFQQTCGPVMAKGVEDTAAYRWFPLTSLAEVGGRPDRFGSAPQDLHRFAIARLASWPQAMNALSTHDTKRSEDVRARLAGLSEVGAQWVGEVRALRACVGELGDPRLEWLMWQTAVGAWPIDAQRLTGYLVKAAREAKVATSWTSPDGTFEAAVADYVTKALTDPAVVAGIERAVAVLEPAFVANCLGQRALQMALPGVPDVFQGCETVNLRLVDPDNRQPPDVPLLTATLDRGLASVPDPRTDLPAAKARLTAIGLRLRRDRPGSFGPDGDYAPVPVDGPAADHAIACVRGGRVGFVATRLAIGLARRGGWSTTTVRLPPGRWTDLLTEVTHEVPASGLAVADLLPSWPVSILVREDD